MSENNNIKKGKPFERMGRKAIGSKAVSYDCQVADIQQSNAKEATFFKSCLFFNNK